jgi:hypothetical protein
LKSLVKDFEREIKGSLKYSSLALQISTVRDPIINVKIVPFLYLHRYSLLIDSLKKLIFATSFFRVLAVNILAVSLSGERASCCVGKHLNELLL